MNEIEWSGELTMQDFVTEYSRRTPVLTKTLTGTFGCDEIHIVSGDEVYWIRGIEKQKRIVAAMKKKKGYVSIPINYPVNFELHVNPDSASLKKSPGKSLNEIVEKLDLASGKKYFIRAVDNALLPFQVGSDAGNSARFGLMEVMDTYEEKYLLGHSICESCIYSDIYAIPLYMNIELSVATTFAKHPHECFDTWFKLVTDLVSNFPKGEVKVCEEIIIFDNPPKDGLYEYIDPKTLCLSEKTKSGLEDYSRDGNPYVRLSPQCPPIKQNLQGAPSTKPDSRCVKLPAIPRRATPPIPTIIQKRRGNDGVESQSCKSIDSNATPPHLLPRKGVVSKMSSDESSVYQDVISHSQQAEAAKKTLADILNEMPRTSVHLKPDSGEVKKTVRSPEIQDCKSRDGVMDNVESIYEVSPLADISKFSIRDVQRCLKVLNMETFCELFDKKQIDGQLLLCMDEEILIKDLNFSKFEAVKLMKFSKHGWRPTQ